ncbi:MAG TPA: hypothetical protein VIP05_05220 [Burkholderiaceae bacterium]
MRMLRFALLALAALLGACQDKQALLPNRANFTAAVDDYLAQRGHLCIAKYDWPITLADADRAARAGDALQMAVLESQGLVAHRDVNVQRDGATVAAREFALTATGQAYFVHTPVVVATAAHRETHAGDFCVARIALERVFGWEAPQMLAGRSVSSVLFSYRVVDPAPWTSTPDARRAFPLVRRAIDNAGTLQLRLGIHLGPKGWVADELTD